MKTNKPDQTDQPDQHGWIFNGQSVLDSKGRNVCTKVNGHLIAAAPDLLEALQLIMEHGFDRYPWPEPDNRNTSDMARAAIAKATGKAGAK